MIKIICDEVKVFGIKGEEKYVVAALSNDSEYYPISITTKLKPEIVYLTVPPSIKRRVIVTIPENIELPDGKKGIKERKIVFEATGKKVENFIEL